MYKRFDFSMMDLRAFLKKKCDQRINISIYTSMLLLQKLGLIEFDEVFELNQKNAKIKHYILTDVRFYIKDDFINMEESERKYITGNLMQEIEEEIKNNY